MNNVTPFGIAAAASLPSSGASRMEKNSETNKVALLRLLHGMWEDYYMTSIAGFGTIVFLFSFRIGADEMQ